MEDNLTPTDKKRLKNKYICIAIKLIRQYHGLASNEMAERLGISSGRLCNIEKARSTPNNALIECYGDIFDIPHYTIYQFATAIGKTDDVFSISLTVECQLDNDPAFRRKLMADFINIVNKENK